MHKSVTLNLTCIAKDFVSVNTKIFWKILTSHLSPPYRGGEVCCFAK